MIDLFAEYVAAAGEVRRRDEDQLQAVGVAREFMVMGSAKFGVGVIEQDSLGTYQPGESGEQAIIMPARPLAMDDDDIVDLIAFRPSQPSKWWLRRGVVPILNPDAILRAEILREPLVIHSTPLAWLRAAGHGCVILDWSASLSLHLSGVHRISPDTPALGAAIERRLRVPSPRMPTIMRRAA